MIHYGLRCTWWETSHVARGRATCPCCRGRLLDMERRDWQEGIEFGKLTDPHYEHFMRWLRGQCFPSHKYAREQYAAWRKAKGYK